MTNAGRATARCTICVRALALLGACMLAMAAYGRGPSTESMENVSLGELPAEAREVYDRILAGGPFRYERDGVVFGNREHLLPSRSRGYYHEYTVPTPGTHNRGARRIICGGPKLSPEACFYTDDHYRSFRRIRA